MKPSETIIKALLEASGKQRISIAFCPYKMAMWVADKLICDPSSVQRTWAGTGKPMEVME